MFTYVVNMNKIVQTTQEYREKVAVGAEKKRRLQTYTSRQMLNNIHF